MEKTANVILESLYPRGNFFEFEKGFYKHLKGIIKDVPIEYKMDTHPAHFIIAMKCENDFSSELVKATRQALQELNNPWKTKSEDLNMQAKYVLKEGVLMLNGTEQKLMPAQQPVHFIFDAIAAANQGR